MSDVYVGSRGNPDARIMFIGEAPGKDEVKEGKPFVGAAGRVLSEMLLKAGIDESECYFTNICNYQPPGNELSTWIGKGQSKSSNLRGVPDDRILQGLDRLDQEIQRVNPNVIVALGNWPLYFLYGQRFNKQGEISGISDYRGYVVPARRLATGRKVVSTFHPSYYLQGGGSEVGLGLFDLRKAAKESAYPDIRRRPREYVIDPLGQEAEHYRQRLLSEGDVLYLDIEFMGRGLICIGYSVSPDWAVTFRWTNSRDCHAFHKSLIESGKPLGAQNATYDCGQLEYHYELDAFKNLKIDTMVAAYVLNIEHRKDLGFLGSLYTDMPPWWDVLDWEKISDGRQSRDEVLPYNCGDNVVTAEVGPVQQKELATDPKMVEAFRFDMDKLGPLWRMSRRGVPCDIGNYTTLKAKVTDDITRTQQTLNDLADGLGMDRRGVDLNAKGPKHMVELLGAWMEIPLTKRTPGGKQFSIDNKVLMEYARRHPQWRSSLEAVLRHREARDFRDKFFNIKIGDDGRWRSYFDGTKTVTRRLSSKEFFPTGEGSNLQNVPAPNSSPTYGGPARACFTTDTVSVPGRGQVKLKFGYADLKGAEFMIVAELTQDPLMLKFADMTLKGTGSVHKETAVFMFADQGITSVDQVSKESPFYFLGKKMRHSGNYLIGWYELMERINAEAMETGVFVDAATTKKMIARYTELHPGLPVWWDETKAICKRDGRIRNLFGFPRVINDKVDRCLPELVAYVPQSTVGDALNFGLVACDGDEELKAYRFELLLNVHDAIAFQYDPMYEDQCLRRVNQLMSIPVRIPKTGKDLIIPVEIQTGYAWHPLEDWHDGYN